MDTKTQIEDEIDLTEIIKKLWKDKILIIGLSLLFGVLAYGIGTLIPKKFEASVKLNNISIIEFQKFNNFFNVIGKTNEEFQSLQSFKGDFYNNFKNEVFSISNFTNFLQTQDDAKSFISLLQNKNSTVSQYLLNDHFKEKQINLRIKNQTEVIPELVFIYPKELKGYDLINRYIQYQAKIQVVQLFNEVENKLNEQLKNNNTQKTLFLENRKRSIENALFDHEQALKIASSINLEETIPTSMLKGNTGSILNEPGALYYKGAKVLRGEIDNLKQDLNNLTKTEGYNQILNEEANIKINISLLQELDFNWNPILQQAVEPEKHISPKKSIFVLVGLFLGFFISLLVIFFRSQVLK
jgi:LPS O-antigen subunit length determinant protein (WzzB/FepE family)